VTQSRRTTERTENPDDAVRIFLRPLASPIPLGFVGLGAGTIVLSSLQLGWVATSEAHQVALAALLVAVPLQFTASLIGFLCRDPVAATGMGTLAVTWLVISATTLFSAPGSRSLALGVVLFYLTGAILVSSVLAAGSKVLAGAVFALAAARFVVTGAYEYLGGTGLETAAGWLGVALCVLALYSALAFELEGLRHAPILPTLRRGVGTRVLSDDGLGPVGPVEREAGVRQQL
jgi:succinate-acetate transporter protein